MHKRTDCANLLSCRLFDHFGHFKFPSPFIYVSIFCKCVCVIVFSIGMMHNITALCMKRFKCSFFRKVSKCTSESASAFLHHEMKLPKQKFRKKCKSANLFVAKLLVCTKMDFLHSESFESLSRWRLAEFIEFGIASFVRVIISIDDDNRSICWPCINIVGSD